MSQKNKSLTTKLDGTSQKGLLNTQMNVEEEANNSNSSERLIEREDIPNSPFTIVNIENKGWFATFGKFRITERGDFTKEELINYIDNPDWTLFINIMSAAITMQDDIKKIMNKGL